MKKLFLVLVLSSFYSFSQDSLNVLKPKLSVIELERIKVVYRGISNPITIAVPSNVKSFIVSGPGVSTTDVIGKYNVRPGSGNELTIKVQMTFLDNSVVVEEHVYQIKELPALIGALNDEFSTQGFLNFSREGLKDAEVGIKMIDFVFNIQLKTTSFLISCNGKSLKIKGNIVNEEAFNFIKKFKKRSLIIISEIRYPIAIDQRAKTVQPIVIELID
jgi:hypothetical protein